MTLYWFPIGEDALPTSNVSYFTQSAAEKANPDSKIGAYLGPLSVLMRSAGVLDKHEAPSEDIVVPTERKRIKPSRASRRGLSRRRKVRDRALFGRNWGEVSDMFRLHDDLQAILRHEEG
jgi:hypothetical protein